MQKKVKQEKQKAIITKCDHFLKKGSKAAKTERFRKKSRKLKLGQKSGQKKKRPKKWC